MLRTKQYTILLLVLIAALTSTSAYANTILDLKTAGNSVTGTAAIGGSFLAQQMSLQPTGTGVIDPFLRIQMTGSEQGYNTSLGTPYDDKAGIWTHALLLSDIPIVTINGTSYRQFGLDINESSGGKNLFLSLNQVQIFQTNGDRMNDTLTPADTSGGSHAAQIAFAGSPTATEVFRMNNHTNTNPYEIQMDYSLD